MRTRNVLNSARPSVDSACQPQGWRADNPDLSAVARRSGRRGPTPDRRHCAPRSWPVMITQRGAERTTFGMPSAESAWPGCQPRCSRPARLGPWLLLVPLPAPPRQRWRRARWSPDRHARSPARTSPGTYPLPWRRPSPCRIFADRTQARSNAAGRSYQPVRCHRDSPGPCRPIRHRHRAAHQRATCPEPRSWPGALESAAADASAGDPDEGLYWPGSASPGKLSSPLHLHKCWPGTYTVI